MPLSLQLGLAFIALLVILILAVHWLEGRPTILRRFWKWLWKERESMTENEVKPPKEW